MHRFFFTRSTLTFQTTLDRDFVIYAYIISAGRTRCKKLLIHTHTQTNTVTHIYKHKLCTRSFLHSSHIRKIIKKFEKLTSFGELKNLIYIYIMIIIIFVDSIIKHKTVQKTLQNLQYV